jgi:hypothetical protein
MNPSLSRAYTAGRKTPTHQKNNEPFVLRSGRVIYASNRFESDEIPTKFGRSSISCISTSLCITFPSLNVRFTGTRLHQ